MLVHSRPPSVIAGTLGAWGSGQGEGVIARSVHALVERYDPSAVDPPLEARVRLTAGDEAHDALLEPGGVRIVRAGRGRPDAVISGTPLLAIHGLGGTKASFLPTLALLRGSHRVIAVDLPGFGDSVKPLRAPFDARYFSRVMTAVLDALGIDRAHVAGNSMGGRIALEMALAAGDRVDRLVLLSPAMAWLRPRRWAPVVRLLRPELTMVPMPVEGLVRRMVPGEGWAAAGVDEFLRAFSTARGRHAFHAALRNIYLDRPHGDGGLWSRLGGMTHDALFVWGRRDRLVPIGFMRHVERTFPAARHLELDCGHVPQVERPVQTHDAIRTFLG